MSSVNYSMPKTLAIGLGANISGPAGSPRSTLIASRPIIEQNIKIWINAFLNEKSTKYSSTHSELNFSWSPLYKSKPIGGPAKQPSFINAVLVVRGGNLLKVNPSERAALDLLQRLCKIEKDFGRDRTKPSIKWGPRSLDLDLLAWGGLQIHNSEIILPHPYLIEREFVLIPLVEAMKTPSKSLIQIEPQKGWQE